MHSTVSEHLPQHTKVKGSSSNTDAGTLLEGKMAIMATMHSTMPGYLPHHTKVEGSSQDPAIGTPWVKLYHSCIANQPNRRSITGTVILPHIVFPGKAVPEYLPHHTKGKGSSQDPAIGTP